MLVFSVGEDALAQIDSALDDPSSDKKALHSSLLDLHDQVIDSNFNLGFLILLFTCIFKQVEGDGELLIRLAKVCRLLALEAEKKSNAEDKKTYAFEAVEWAKLAVEKCPNSCEALVSIHSETDLILTNSFQQKQVVCNLIGIAL